MEDYELVVTAGDAKGRVIAIPSAHFMIGSAPEVELRFSHELVEPRHAELEIDSTGRLWVRDLTGRGLVQINGERLELGPLDLGGFLKLGGLELALREPLGARRPGNPSGTQQTPSVEKRAAAAASAARAGLQPNEVIDGRYQVLAKLAVGGMGEVYRAQHIELGKPVVIKVMLASLSEDPQIVARFKREAVAASRIGQQNIVDVSDFGRTPDGRFFFVMEWLDGITLKRLLAQEGAQPVARVLHLTLQIARALVSTHAQAIVHRDLKPENLMVLQRPGQRDFIKVLDFGVAKIAPAAGEGGHTSSGLVIGTPQYMSPEQALAAPVDARSDIYSLGLILFELLAGKPTFTADTPSSLMVKHVTEAPPRLPAKVLAGVSTELERTLFQMLAKEPLQRQQTMQEVVDALEQLQAQQAGAQFVHGRIAAGQTQGVERGGKGAERDREVSTTTVMGAPVVRPATLPPQPLPPPPARPRAPLVVGALAVALLGAGAVAWANRPAPAQANAIDAPPRPQLAPPRPENADAPPGAPRAESGEAPSRPLPPKQAAVLEPTPPAAAAAVAVTLLTPTPAEVFEAGVPLGPTPLTLTRAAGSQATLTFKAVGFKPLTRVVAFASAEALTLPLEREKPAAAPPPPRKPPKPRPEEELKAVPF